MEIAEDKNIPNLWLFSGIDTGEVRKEARRIDHRLLGPEKTGSAVDSEDRPTKSNSGIFLNEVYSLYGGLSVSPMAETLSAMVKALGSLQCKPESYANYARGRYDLSFLYSKYVDGDFYRAHRDETTLTFLLWFAEGDFSGGGLTFPSFNAELPFKAGCGVAFPSHYEHSVVKVESLTDNAVRMCCTAFLR